jgi:hypothetical protein
MSSSSIHFLTAYLKGIFWRVSVCKLDFSLSDEDKADMSSFKNIETVLKVSLLPCHTEYPLSAVKQQINELLFRYHEDVNGVPIFYHELKLPPTKEYGRIMNELPWLHIDILVKLLVFQPQEGDILSGQINKVK